MRNDSLIVVAARAQMPTFPQSLVKVPIDTLPIRFSEAHVKIQCDKPGS